MIWEHTDISSHCCWFCGGGGGGGGGGVGGGGGGGGGGDDKELRCSSVFAVPSFIIGNIRPLDYIRATPRQLFTIGLLQYVPTPSNLSQRHLGTVQLKLRVVIGEGQAVPALTRHVINCHLWE
jgi:hypothetical protein